MFHNQDKSLATVSQLNQCDANGDTPLIKAIHHAFCQPSREATQHALALIINPAVDLSATDKHNKTALHYARLYSKVILIAAIEKRLKRECRMRFFCRLWHTPYNPAPENVPSANFDKQRHFNVDL